MRSPRIQGGDMMLLGEVVALDPDGGPWQRGYLRAERALSPEDWFFQGHFKDDPCMPGTLMFEACIQALSVWLTALGWTLDRDGWRFQTVRDARYDMRCRGQATPRSKRVVTELFIEEQRRGPRPVVFADVLVSVDGLAAFHCRRLGVELVPDWPLSTLPSQAEAAHAEARGEPDPRFSPFGLLSSAWGRPSDAFGPDYAVCDLGRRAPRLPGPPYQFMTTVRSVSRPFGLMLPGHDARLGPEPVEAVIDYEVPPDAWFFRATGFMPFAVLLEAALQPCGWLACWTGSALLGEEVFFRNLDGEGTCHATIRPDIGTLRTRTRLTSLSRLGPMILVQFEVEVTASGAPVFACTTSFGFFPAEALARQAGLPIPADEPARLTAPGRRFWTGEAAPALSAGVEPPDLTMLHRSMALSESPGHAILRGEHDVNPASWFFKAHFFDDPVQPGSLGVSAMLELLERYARDVGIAAPGESLPVLLGETISWKYRGQVRPHNRDMRVLAEVRTDAETVRGTASLWVDGARIYEAKLGVGKPKLL